MKSVVRIQGQGKVKDVGLRGLPTLPVPESVDTTVALIQALIPLGLTAVAEALTAEVVALAGERYSRTGGRPGVVRWCQQRGSVSLADQKLPITYRRVRVSRVTQFSLVVVIENTLPVPCMVGYAIASAPLRRPALIFSLSR